MFPQSEKRAFINKDTLKYPGLRYNLLLSRKRGRVYQYVQRLLREQFGRPSGLWGILVGMIMANTPSNKDRVHWTVSLLKIKPEDRILEIGFGTGYAIKIISKIATDGFVAGVDHSEVMVRHASKRNISAINEGKVVLKLGSVSNLPKFNEPFDKIFTINSIHFWNNPVECLKELRDLLRHGGLISVTLQPRSRGATDSIARDIGKEVATNLEHAGFSQVRLELRKTKTVSVVCALGIR